MALLRLTAVVTLGSLVLAAVPVSCRRTPAAKPRREEGLRQSSAEQRAVAEFADAVRQAFAWLEAQPPAADPPAAARQRQELLKRFEQVPAQGLPPEMDEAWRLLLEVWKSSSSSEEIPRASAVNARGAKAAEQLNRQLASFGYVDFRF